MKTLCLSMTILTIYAAHVRAEEHTSTPAPQAAPPTSLRLTFISAADSLGFKGRGFEARLGVELEPWSAASLGLSAIHYDRGRQDYLFDIGHQVAVFKKTPFDFTFGIKTGVRLSSDASGDTHIGITSSLTSGMTLRISRGISAFGEFQIGQTRWLGDAGSGNSGPRSWETIAMFGVRAQF